MQKKPGKNVRNTGIVWEFLETKKVGILIVLLNETIASFQLICFAFEEKRPRP